jgi:peptide/nickel transport system permease protein
LAEASIDPDAADRVEADEGKVKKRLGFGFWLPFGWIVFLFGCALSAELWHLPEPDAMHFVMQAATPGAVGEVEIDGDDGAYTFLLGGDNMGRDIFARLIFGSRVSLAVGLLAPLFGLAVGGLLGMLAGYYRGWIEALVVAVADVIVAFPALVFLIVITFYLGPTLPTVTFALGLLSIPFFIRVARANTLTFAEREFVIAARAMGAGDLRVLAREIFPNVIMAMLVYGLFVTAVLIVIEGVLSFLGLSVGPPTVSWGGMINEGRDYLDEAPHISMIPAFVMFLTVLSFNLLGDTLRGLADPRESRL